MAAFNWIIIDGRCPRCGVSGRIRCQTHVASDYGGDARGRFQDREYRLGEELWWWPSGHPRFDAWRIDGRLEPALDGSVEEACYSRCASCGAELVVVLRFANLRAERVVGPVREEADWPEGYFR